MLSRGRSQRYNSSRKVLERWLWWCRPCRQHLTAARSFGRSLKCGEGEVKLGQGELSLSTLLHSTPVAMVTRCAWGCTWMEMEVERALTSPSSSHWWGENTMLYCHGRSDRQWHWCFSIKTSKRTSSNHSDQIPPHPHFNDQSTKWMWHQAVRPLPLSPSSTILPMSKMTQCS